MELDGLKKDVFEVWVPFQDAKVLVRYVPRDALQALKKKATKISWERHQQQETVDAELADRLIGRAAVRGWEGFTMHGEPFPFSEENLDFLMSKWTEFAKFVNQVCIDLEELTRAEREASLKKS